MTCTGYEQRLSAELRADRSCSFGGSDQSSQQTDSVDLWATFLPSIRSAGTVSQLIRCFLWADVVSQQIKWPLREKQTNSPRTNEKNSRFQAFISHKVELFPPLTDWLWQLDPQAFWQKAFPISPLPWMRWQQTELTNVAAQPVSRFHYLVTTPNSPRSIIGLLIKIRPISEHTATAMRKRRRRRPVTGVSVLLRSHIRNQPRKNEYSGSETCDRTRWKTCSTLSVIDRLQIRIPPSFLWPTK